MLKVKLNKQQIKDFINDHGHFQKEVKRLKKELKSTSRAHSKIWDSHSDARMLLEAERDALKTQTIDLNTAKRLLTDERDALKCQMSGLEIELQTNNTKAKDEQLAQFNEIQRLRKEIAELKDSHSKWCDVQEGESAARLKQDFETSDRHQAETDKLNQKISNALDQRDALQKELNAIHQNYDDEEWQAVPNSSFIKTAHEYDQYLELKKKYDCGNIYTDAEQGE